MWSQIKSWGNEEINCARVEWKSLYAKENAKICRGCRFGAFVEEERQFEWNRVNLSTEANGMIETAQIEDHITARILYFVSNNNFT